MINKSTDEAVQMFENATSHLLHNTFPEKKIVVMENDKVWFNEELRNLKRQRMREYGINGKSAKYFKLLNEFKDKAKVAMEKHKEKLKIDVLEGRRGSVYPSLKKLATRPGSSQNQFHLPSHTSRCLSPKESAEIIANHFSEISQEYQPLHISSLPPRVRSFLTSIDHSYPQLSVSDVQARIIKARKPLGIVPGDLPRRLVQKCADLIASPAQIIFNAITASSNYPKK